MVTAIASNGCPSQSLSLFLQFRENASILGHVGVCALKSKPHSQKFYTKSQQKLDYILVWSNSEDDPRLRFPVSRWCSSMKLVRCHEIKCLNRGWAIRYIHPTIPQQFSGTPRTLPLYLSSPGFPLAGNQISRISLVLNRPKLLCTLLVGKLTAG